MKEKTPMKAATKAGFALTAILVHLLSQFLTLILMFVSLFFVWERFCFRAMYNVAWQVDYRAGGAWELAKVLARSAPGLLLVPASRRVHLFPWFNPHQAEWNMLIINTR